MATRRSTWKTPLLKTTEISPVQVQYITETDSAVLEGSYGSAEPERVEFTLPDQNHAPAANPPSAITVATVIPKPRQKNLLLFATLLAAMDSFLFGYDTGIISSAMLYLKDDFNLNTLWQEVLVSVTIGAAAIFALLGGVINDYFGRKPATLIASGMFFVGAFTLGLANSKEMLVMGRIIVGMGIGLSSMTVPVYIAECAQADIRGRLVNIHQLMITIGIFVASMVGGGFSYTDGGWRYMLGLSGIPAGIQFIGFCFVPRSPRWLVSWGEIDKAREVLIKLRNVSDVEEELLAIQKAQESSNMGEVCSTFPMMMRTSSVRKALTVGCALQMFQQLAGINTVGYYAATIIKMSGIGNNSDAIWLSAGIMLVNMLCTVVSLWIVDRAGRKILLLASYIGVFFSLILLAVSFQLSTYQSAVVSDWGLDDRNICTLAQTCDECVERTACGFCFLSSNSNYSLLSNSSLANDALNGSCLLASHDHHYSAAGLCMRDTPVTENAVWAYNYCPTPLWWLTFLGMLVYICAFAPGLGPIPWTVNSEIYPMWARSTGNALSTSTNWFFNLLVSMTFLTLTEQITKYGTFWMYAGISLLGIIVVQCWLPETKGHNLEEVNTLFAASPVPKRLCRWPFR